MKVDADLLKALKASGLGEDTALGIAAAIERAIHGRENDLVTKSDLRAATAELRSEMAGVKTELLKWYMPMLLSQIGLFITILWKH